VEVCPPHLSKPAKSLARVPSLRVRLVILPGGIPVPGSVKGFVRDIFPTPVFAFHIGALIYYAILPKGINKLEGCCVASFSKYAIV